jgi:transcriptional regulator with XRE-family HTH domain
MAKEVSFAEWLNEQLQLRGLNQRQLAKLAGVSPATIYKLLNSKTKQPKPETCKRIAKALKISPNRVLRVANIMQDENKFPEQDDLIYFVGQLIPEKRQEILDIVKALSKN